MSDFQTFFIKGTCDTDKELDIAFKILCADENDTVRSKIINILGRDIKVEKTCDRVADMTFQELCGQARGATDYLTLARVFHTIIIRDIPLCGQARGATDYLTLARVFHTIIIRDIPVFTRDNLNESRRFITLIDTFYDQKVRILCSLDAEPEHLFQINETSELSDSQKILMDDLKVKHGSTEAQSNLFTGLEEMFAFNRTVSRLCEMQTHAYWMYRKPSSVH
uniref:AFG1-like ATPase n=1 Tax=Panagrolaimus sp. JU765 TaxID=591449 RepID=A0AC34QRA1_9BILA